MYLDVIEDGEHKKVAVNEGEVLLLPPHLRHSPQRPEAGSIGLVVEPKRPAGAKDALEWYCLECTDLVHRVEFQLNSIVEDLPPAYENFYADADARTCGNCGALHPGKKH